MKIISRKTSSPRVVRYTVKLNFCSGRSSVKLVGVIGEIALPFFNFDPIVFPKDGADTINPKLLTLLREHSDLYTGCLVCDFINAELAGTIYMRNFNR